MITSYYNRFKEKYYQNRGQRFLSQGLNQKAYNCFEKAILLNNDYINQFNMGLVLTSMNKHQWDKAIECYKKLHENHTDFSLYKNNYQRLLDPDLREKYVQSREFFFKGLLLQDQKLINEALEAFQQAIALDSNNAMLYNTIGIAMMIAKKDKKDIEYYFEKAVSLSPQNEGFKRNLARIKMKK